MFKAKELVMLCGGRGTRLGEETEKCTLSIDRLIDIGFEKNKGIDFGINELFDFLENSS